jgi:hypothetical protein
MLHIHGRLLDFWMATKDPAVERQASELWKTITHTKSAASKIDPSDDSWMVRLLRARLDQDPYETPPEWMTWLHGADLDWAQFHLLETSDVLFENFEDDDGKFHFTKIPAVPAATSWHPKNTGKRTYERKKPTWGHSEKPFKGLLKDAPATWEYRHEDEIRSANYRGLNKWILRGEEHIGESNAKHKEELEESTKLHLLKCKGNTGGRQPESAREPNRQEIMRRTPKFVDEVSSPISTTWTGDDFVVEDQVEHEYKTGFRVGDLPIQITAEERAAAFADHKMLVEAGAVDLREDEIIVDFEYGNISGKKAAKKLNMKEEAFYQRIRRRRLEAQAMKEGKKNIPRVSFTYEEAADIADNGARYILIELNSEWHWHKLNLAKYGDVDEAIAGLKAEKLSEAMRQRKEYKAAKDGTNLEHPEWKAAFVELIDRYRNVFDPANYQLSPVPWKGLIARLTGGEECAW